LESKKFFSDAIRYGFKRFTGTPIETDLGPYRLVARNIKEISGAMDAQALGTGDSADMAACFALACEACRTTLGLEPYEEQLIAAAAMCRGKVAQMQTGEGKTLAAAIAACFCAKRDGRVHIITANDYLARRDASWMRPIYESLGLTVASIGGNDATEERRAAYRADILYLTARELGFDYLRDGLACKTAELVQVGFNSAIVDEADFILIDEARIPLVIAGMDADSARFDADIALADKATRALSQGKHFTVDTEGRKVSLTLEGQAEIESSLGLGGMHEASAAPIFARVHASLHAHTLLSRDVDYVVKNGEAKLVDAFTGRVAEKRQWPWGIQAAIEAKEGLPHSSEGRIYGSITVQHLMELYPRIAAMTATAVPAAQEFSESYGMGTVIIPSVRPSRRRDEPDRIYWNRAAKLAAIVAEIEAEHGRGRPILVGTASIRESEELAAALDTAGITYALLNAKNDEKEAADIAAAGQRGAVTISTNMAGRGTDIKLGDDPRITELGGLYVMGTNKHESRRVDDQLRGRAGRQGDPGLSRFFISLEDDLFERYGVREFLPPAYRQPSATYTQSIDDRIVRKEINRAQAIIAGQNAKIRAGLRKYSIIVEFDRRYVRQLRDAALVNLELHPEIEAALVADNTSAVDQAMRAAIAQVFVARLDAFWADHLSVTEDVREGIALRRYAGKNPELEFIQTLGESFEAGMSDLVAATITDANTMIATGRTTVAESSLPPRPSSTWTYVVENDALPGMHLGTLTSAAAFILGPLALILFLAERLALAVLGKTGNADKEKPGVDN